MARQWSQHEAIRLPDGRVLAFSQYGDKGGVPILWFHGGESCRIEAAHADRAARELGVRIVAPDRPGIGRSDHKEGRGLRDWPADVSALTRELGIDRFITLGWGAGGPYSLACAAESDGAVVRSGLVAGPPPRDGHGSAWHGVPAAERVMSAVSRSVPEVSGSIWRVGRALGAGPLDWVFERLHHSEDGLRDVPLEAPSPGEAYMEAVVGGVRGIVRDHAVFGEPWGFTPEDVMGEVHLFYGGETLPGPDSVHMTPGWELLHRLPNARLHTVPGRYRVSLPGDAHRVLSTLLTGAAVGADS